MVLDSPKQRNQELDILKGVGMLLVIIGHSGCIWPFYHAIYAFHMPLFFIVSGLFFSTSKSIWTVIKNGYKQLIRSYLAIVFVTTLLLFLLKDHYGVFLKSALLGASVPNDYNMRLGPIWFLLALYWSRVIYRVLAQWLDETTRTVVISLIAFAILVFQRYVCKDLFRFPYNIMQGFFCLFYYHIGVLLRKHNALDVLKGFSRNKSWLLISISLSLLGVSLIVDRLVGASMNISLLRAPFMPIDVLNAIGLTLSLYVVILKISAISQRVEFLQAVQNALQFLGKYSLVLFAIHCVEYQTTIPMISKLAKSLMEIASNSIQKAAVLLINPIVQIAICVLLVCLWHRLKIMRFK